MKNVSQKLETKLELYSGFTHDEIKADILEKQKVLDWMVAKKLKTTNDIGLAASLYYTKNKELMEIVEANKDPSELETI